MQNEFWNNQCYLAFLNRFIEWTAFSRSNELNGLESDLACVVQARNREYRVPEDTRDKILEIKKYPNRRYYDATHSRHLTLEEIRSLIQQGYDLRVIDAKTSADITAQVLTQIILELDTPKLDSLPVPLLVRLIRMNDQLVKDFIEKYFNQALKSFFDYQKQLEEQIRKTHGLPPVFPSVSAWTKAVLEPFSAVFSGASAAKTAEGQPPRAEKEQDLHKLVRELQKEVASLKKKPAAKDRRTRPKK
jgi:polyhydroxyalkanoate synthesis repressor PhaR